MSADMDRLVGRAVWVVGASSGIGAALASELVDRGARVAILIPVRMWAATMSRTNRSPKGAR